MEKQIHMIVFGKVQGVFFRDSTQKKAQELNLRGTVRNLRDGSVEIYAQGEQTTIGKLESWCRIGPPAARVDRVEIKELPPQSEFHLFHVLY